MSTENTNETAGAEQASGKKYKMSDIIAAFREHDVETDVKGVLAYCDEDGAGSICDLSRMSMEHTRDVSMSLVHLGLSQLIMDAMHCEPEAVGVFAKYHARETREEGVRKGFKGVLGMLAGGNID